MRHIDHTKQIDSTIRGAASITSKSTARTTKTNPTITNVNTMNAKFIKQRVFLESFSFLRVVRLIEEVVVLRNGEVDVVFLSPGFVPLLFSVTYPQNLSFVSSTVYLLLLIAERFFDMSS